MFRVGQTNTDTSNPVMKTVPPKSKPMTVLLSPFLLIVKYCLPVIGLPSRPSKRTLEPPQTLVSPIVCISPLAHPPFSSDPSTDWSPPGRVCRTTGRGSEV